jgi:LacI family transcriptional regulator
VARPPKTRRVTLLETLQSDLGFGVVQGVLDYAAHQADWRFEGLGSTPFGDLGVLTRAKVDGVIGGFHADDLAALPRNSGVAVVSTDPVSPGSRMPCVTNDDRATGRLGAEYLLDRGFAHLGFFGAEDDLASERRCEGFQSTIEAAGRVCHVRTYASDQTLSDPRERIPVWLDELPKPIAIMAHQDQLARLTVNAAIDKSLRVPDDVAVLGVYNNRWTSVLAARPVSSIDLDYHRIGYFAAEMLDALMDGGAPPPPRLIKPLGVVTRASTDITLVGDDVVSDALCYIREHCTDGLHVEDVLDHLQVSRRNLELRMKRSVGLTPQIAITRAQVDRAKQMLLESRMPIEAVARRCGFRQRTRLNEAFKRITGLTPGEFRQQRPMQQR